MTRLINADALTDTFKRALKHRELYAEWELYDTIDCAPTIDAEQVVRCKDCKWADWYKTAGGEQFCYCIETDSGGRTANDFCSYGERREP